MKVFTFCWNDKNFGDDMFLEILTKRFKNIDFYVKSQMYADDLTVQFENFKTISNEIELIESGYFDSYLLVGGDMFPNNADYRYSIKILKMFKEQNKPISFIGCSFKHEYSDKTIQDIKEVCTFADSIVVRDKFSYNFLKSLGIKVVIQGADIVLSLYENNKFNNNSNVKLGKLGISIRRAMHISEEMQEEYCLNNAKFISSYLSMNKNNTVVLFCFSSGSIIDLDVAKNILDKLHESIKDSDRQRVSIVEYNLNINEFINDLNECEYIFGTRFHAIIFSVILRKKFIPFIYEDKTINFLNDIEFLGTKIDYSDFKMKINIALESLYSDNKQFDVNNILDQVKLSELNFEVPSLKDEVE